MTTITSKNETWTIEDEMTFRERVRERIEEVKKTNPACYGAGLDTMEFLEDFYSYRMKHLVSVYSEKNHIIFLWDTPQEYVKVTFKGDGVWCYEVKSDDHQLTFEGKGRAKQKPEPNEGGYWFFVTPLKKYITIPDTFKNVYEPCYRRGEHCTSFSVSIEWCTNYYDGPLSGYCTHNNKLHYFHVIEETEITQDRMYAIYKLSLWDKIMAYARDAKFSFITQHQLAWIVSMFFRKKDGWIKRVKKREQWKESLEIVGFFT